MAQYITTFGEFQLGPGLPEVFREIVTGLGQSQYRINLVGGSLSGRVLNMESGSGTRGFLPTVLDPHVENEMLALVRFNSGGGANVGVNVATPSDTEWTGYFFGENPNNFGAYQLFEKNQPAVWNGPLYGTIASIPSERPGAPWSWVRLRNTSVSVTGSWWPRFRPESEAVGVTETPAGEAFGAALPGAVMTSRPANIDIALLSIATAGDVAPTGVLLERQLVPRKPIFLA